MPMSTESMTGETQLTLMMSYAAELELEVDRLRRRDQFLQQEAQELLRDIHVPPGYHPSFKQVIAMAVCPLAEHVFRCQQRLSGASNAVLRLALEPSRRFGFVEMRDQQARRQAIEGLHLQQIAGRAITVNEARPREERRGGVTKLSKMDQGSSVLRRAPFVPKSAGFGSHEAL